MPAARPSRPAADPDALPGLVAHPHRAGIDHLRAALRSADPRITEAVKWNAPSFRIDDDFATFKLHPPRDIQIVLHTGAKVRTPPLTMALDVPGLRVTRAAPDRCVLVLADTATAVAHTELVVAAVRQWIAQLDASPTDAPPR